jgi:LCP family protein required for cell wall assembly
MASRLLKKKTSAPLRVLKVFYILLVLVSVGVVGLFVTYNVLVQAPDVAEQVTFPISVATDSGGEQVTTVSDDGDASSSSSSSGEDVVVYTRREGVYTCLLTGSDEGGQRADTIMLGCFDTNNQTASLISIPRDTLVLKNGKKSKINAIYSSGQGEAMAAAVSEMLAVPVDYYVSVDLNAFKSIVKAIGGVTFDVPINMNYDDPTQNLHIHLKKGTQKLGAEDAMGVVRFRHNNDGSGYARQDLDRVETQRNFLKAVVKQTITLSNVTKVTELIGILNEYVDTNMPLDTMVYFATSAIGMDLDTALTTATIPGTWKSPYMITDADGALELVNELLPVYTEPVTKNIMNIQTG